MDMTVFPFCEFSEQFTQFTRHYIVVPVTHVGTVLGMLTNLPCNITPSLPGDRVLLVLWYKDGYGKPSYNFDLRQNKEIRIFQQEKNVVKM